MLNSAEEVPCVSDRSREIDQRIVDELRADPRQSNVAIGRTVGLSEGAVRRRVENLSEAGLIRFTVAVDPAFDGRAAQALLRLRCAPHLIDEVMAALSHMRELTTVYLCTGQFDITAVGQFGSTDELRSFATTRLGTIPGVVEMQSELILSTIEPSAAPKPPVAAEDDE